MNISGHCQEIDLGSDRLFLVVLYSIVFCVGLPANCLALVGLYRLVKAENILPVFVINLLLSDLLQIAILPLWVDYYLSKHRWRFGRVSCSIAGCIFYISLFVSIFFMCCIALERYLAIAHPLRYGSYRRLSTAVAISVGLWAMVALGISTAFNIGLDDNEYPLCMETYDSNRKYAAFQLASTTLTFLLPLALLVFIYASARRRIGGVTSVPRREKRKIIGLLTLIVAMFLLLFGPYHILVCVTCAGILALKDSCSFQAGTFIYVQVSTGLLSLNSLLDPVMYIFIRKDFQKVVGERFPFLRTMGCWRSMTGDQTETSIPPPSQLEHAL